MKHLVEEQLMSMEIGVYQEITFSNGILKSTREFCRIAEDEWAIEYHGCGWSTAYMSLKKATDYLEGKIKGYELDWEDNEIIL